MAIFKASYTRTASGAKRNIRYIQNRQGKDGQKIVRTLYSWDGKIERNEAYEIIDEAEPGSYFFRLIISPDPETEDTNRDIYLRTVTEQTMRGLEDHLHTHIQWIAATHQDHAPHRHMHILAILPRKLTRNDLFAGRAFATQAARDQRHERDLQRSQQQERGSAWEQQH